MKKFIIFIGVNILLMRVVLAGGAPSNVASEITQIANNIQLAAQVAEQARNVEELIAQGEIIFANAERLDALFGTVVRPHFEEVASVINRGTVLSYAAENLNERFVSQYPGYLEFLELELEDFRSPLFNQQYDLWNTTQRDNIASVLESIGLNAAEINSESDLFDILQEQTGSAIGRNQIQQAANTIAIEQGKQTQKLRQLILQQTQLQANYYAHLQARQGLDNAEATKHAENVELKKLNLVQGDGEEF